METVRELPERRLGVDAEVGVLLFGESVGGGRWISYRSHEGKANFGSWALGLCRF